MSDFSIDESVILPWERHLIPKKQFKKAKKDLFREISGIFSSFISSNNIEGHSEAILNAFLKFKFRCPYDLDFEFDYNNFQMLIGGLNFSSTEWISVYGLFRKVFSYNNKINNFIYLFFYNLIYKGPFGEDIGGLDMSDELLALTGDDFKRLYNLFDEYFETDDSSLIQEIIKTSKLPSVPSFAVIHLANWLNYHFRHDKSQFGDEICELYAEAVKKIHKRPEFSDNYDSKLDEIRFELDTSGFSDKQIDYVLNIIGGIKYEESKNYNSKNNF